MLLSKPSNNCSAMESYIGERVLVTLRDPPDTQVNGLVTEIIGQELCLRDGE